eukprot:CAMPEP_0116066136 /NCGR_PEP_ID=MMETSP0322-20121206/10197_1 /TAXON_ID=163516 /ORGANISM="Leptocylindrus danicus var. apora, Strain B651" /LENGTH=522 /DNA_ID=CAMNT_0003552621 /DNA_START=20 /DNA_END=1588 /DNA_ORIENTATION=-
MTDAPISAEDAVAKAKQIAARLALSAAPPAPAAHTTNDHDPGSAGKRKRWSLDPNPTSDHNENHNDPSSKKSKAQPAAGVPGQYGPSSTSTALTTNESAAAGGGALVGAPAVAAAFGLGYAPTAVQAQMNASASSGELMTENLGVPNHLVGYIIGRGGESITKMQRQTGCRVQIQKEHEMAPGATNRVITLSSTSADAIVECRAIVEGMVQEKSMTAAGAALSGNGGMNSSFPSVTLQVPDGDVGLVIGKGGANIKSIQLQSQANVQIPQQGDVDNPSVRTVTITAPTQEGAALAKSLIEATLANKISAPSMNEVSLELEVPDKDVGMVIGRGGCVIKEMQNRTRCRIQIPQMCAPGSPNRLITVYGPADGVTSVKTMIERIIMEQSSHFVMQGATFSNGYQQQGQYGGQSDYYGAHQGYQDYGNGGGGGQQKDYSSEWAAYYAAQAAAQGGSAGASAQAEAPAPAPTDPTAYYGAFWEYVAHYGEAAARQYYGAWSPPEGTPNPNLSGTTTSAPASSSAQE